MGYRQAPITSWGEASRRQLLDVVRAQQVLLVAYDGCEVKPLWNCTQAYGYEFVSDSSLAVQSAPTSNAPPSERAGNFVARDFDATAPRTAECQSATHGIVGVRLESPESLPDLITLNPLRVVATSPTCAAGEELRDGQCVAAPSACETGYVRVADGTCAPLPVPSEDWYVPPDATAPSTARIREALTSLRRPLVPSKNRVEALLTLAADYAQEKDAAAVSSRVRALAQLTKEAAFVGHPQELSSYAELIALTRNSGERSVHLDAANRMRERFPDAPETAVAYLTLARYYCDEGQPAAAERFFSQMRRNVKMLNSSTQAEMDAIKKRCASAKAAD